MNTITVTGYVFRDAERRTSANGNTFLSFTVKDWQGKDVTNWWSVKLFGKRAESIELPDGTPISVSGRVEISKKDDKTYVNLTANDVFIINTDSKAQPKAQPKPKAVPDLFGEEEKDPFEE